MWISPAAIHLRVILTRSASQEVFACLYSRDVGAFLWLEPTRYSVDGILTEFFISLVDFLRDFPHSCVLGVWKLLLGCCVD